MIRTLRNLVCLLSILIGLQTFAQTPPELQWGVRIGSNSADNVWDMTVDQLGNVLTVGRVQGAADMDPGPGVANLAQKGALDLYILKLDATGNYLWSQKFTAGNNAFMTGVTTDENNNIYVSGFFNGTGDFDPGPATLTYTASGAFDCFLSKFSPDGNLIWSYQFGSFGYDNSNAVSYDGHGHILMAGRFSDDSVDVDPGPGVYKIWPETGGGNIFILSLDTSGAFRWAHSIGTPHINPDIAFDIQADSKGNVYTTGTFFGNTDFDPGPGTTTLSATNSDIFLLKLDSNGVFKWAFDIGSSSAGEIGRRVRVDAQDNVYLCGEFWSTADFNPGAAVNNLVALNGDAFVAKYDSSGNYLWALRISSGNTDYAYGMSVDPGGSVYVTGPLGGTVDFDPGAGVYNLTTVALRDAFIAKYNSAGQFEWAGQIGTTSQNEGRALCSDGLYQTYWSGTFLSTTDTDPSAAVNNLTAVGASDIFISKFGVNFPLPVKHTVLLGEHCGDAHCLNWRFESGAPVTAVRLEHSDNGQSFSAVSLSAQEVSQQRKVYRPEHAGSHWYRLQIGDADGQQIFSETVQLTQDGREAGIGMQTMAGGEVLFHSAQAVQQITVYNLQGQVLLKAENTNRINIAQVPVGHVLIRVQAGNEQSVFRMVR